MSYLFKHQEEGVQFLMSRKGSGALIWEPGTGKTRAMIETAKEMRKAYPGIHFLVVCPISILEATWGNQIKEYSDFSYRNCHKLGIPDVRKPHDSKFSPDYMADFLLINYESIRIERNFDALLRLVAMYQVMAILDESSKIKAHDTKTTKTLLQLAPKFHARVILSGTPTPNSEVEWWPQMNFVDPWILSSSFNKFKNSFFHWENPRGQAMNIPQGAFMTREVLAKLHKTGCEMKITPASRAKLMETISPLCSVVRKRQCLDLPEEIDQVREVSMNDKQARAYKDMKEQLVAELGDLFEGETYLNPIVAQNGLTKTAKLREITSGFAINDQGAEVVLGTSPKIQELLAIADECAGQQIIIWANYKWEIRTIEEALSKIAPVSTLYGDTPDRDASIEAFIKKETRFFVANPQSAAHGLDGLQRVCSMQVFFSLSYSMEQYDQARSRIHRSGQTEKCLFVHLLAKDTIDAEILSVVQGKKTAQDVLLNMIPKFKFAGRSLKSHPQARENTVIGHPYTGPAPSTSDALKVQS